MKDLPAPVQTAIQQRYGEIVAPGADFDRTDLIRVGRNRRLIFVWKRQDRWVVATEHGGLAYNDPVFSFAWKPGEVMARFQAKRNAFPNNICKIAAELITDQPAK